MPMICPVLNVVVSPVGAGVGGIAGIGVIVGVGVGLGVGVGASIKFAVMEWS